MKSEHAPRIAIFSYGFRPFFLLAGWFAVIGFGGWFWLFSGNAAWSGALPASQWHAHEMLFGFVVAAIAGFMLTAVPSWTGSKGIAGSPLVVLTLLWLLGRIAFALAGSLPVWVTVLTELAFLPCLAAMIAPALLRARNRNTPLILVLMVLWAADVVFLQGLSRADPALAHTALSFAINLVLLLITVIGGRIVPVFTANALRLRGVDFQMRSMPLVGIFVIASMVLVVLADIFLPGTKWAGWVALAAGLLQAWRLTGWNGHKTLGEPIVWVLHLGYAWLPIGLLLKATHLLGGFSWAAFWLHALTAGAAAMMILAVMSRASLGHTGRPLKVAPIMSVSYLLVATGAALRVFGSAIMPVSYFNLIALAGGLWSAGFLIFALVYTPILLDPRADGKSG